ncbi:hypothetical protein BJ878DRAFT_522247 [Calycina marina]|uniref:Secreted protein n=1 Tax=Calycina marina TaxID=1763456 RepID=A0A9P7YXW8_9HELO|nr:hypothetical protein BJ878DRAFT_522247 [Calycina marina]
MGRLAKSNSHLSVVLATMLRFAFDGVGVLRCGCWLRSRPPPLCDGNVAISEQRTTIKTGMKAIRRTSTPWSLRLFVRQDTSGAYC